MIHKYLRNDYNFYTGRGLLDYFITEDLTLNTSTSFNLGWLSKVSDRCFWYRKGDNPTINQRVGCELDTDSIKCLKFRNGLYPNDLPWWKFHDNIRAERIVPAIGNYLNTIGFTIQMTCTYEQFSKWGAIMGMCLANYPVGLSLGQYDNGYVGWGFYPVTVNGVANQHVRVKIAASLIPSVKFNWCFVYNIYDGRSLRLYINGQEAGSANMPLNWSWTTHTGAGALGLSLGYNYDGANRHFKGNIYSLLMYNKALNNNEIYQNYMYDKQKYLIPN